MKERLVGWMIRWTDGKMESFIDGWIDEHD